MKHERSALEKMPIGKLDELAEIVLGITTSCTGECASKCLAEVERRGLTAKCLEEFAIGRVENQQITEGADWPFMWALFTATDKEKIIAAILAVEAAAGDSPCNPPPAR